MKLFREKEKINESNRILGSLVEGLKFGEENKDIEHIKKVLELATTGEYETQFSSVDEKIKKDDSAFFNLMKGFQENFDLEQKKKMEDFKKRNKFWYKFKSNISTKFKLFGEKMVEVWSFIKHEFLTIRKLIFFINDQFFGKEYKNRKLFYLYKNQLIESNGYTKGERRYNTIVRNITKGAELNKRIIESHG
jgi:hypothetical protein